MPSNRWSCNARSLDPSYLPSGDRRGDLERYARRFAHLMSGVGPALGVSSWHEPPSTGSGFGPEITPNDVSRLRELLESHELYDDVGNPMPTAGIGCLLLGQRRLAPGESEVQLQPIFGRPDGPGFVLVQVEEPVGHGLWSYPPEPLAALVAAVVDALSAIRAKLDDDDLGMLLANADPPPSLDVGSHVYLHRPVDLSRVPPGTRQVPCGRGALLIVPPGPDDQDTLRRMEWLDQVIRNDTPPQAAEPRITG